MIDIREVRADPEAVRVALGRRGLEGAVVDRLVELDGQARQLSAQRDDVRAQIKTLSKEVGAARKAGDATSAPALERASRELGDQEKKLDAEASEAAAALRALLLVTPNLPAADCPDGKDEHDNVVMRVEGFDESGYGPHQRVPHWDIGAALGILDLERGARMSGLDVRGDARLGRDAWLAALCQLALDRNADAFEEIRPPTLVRTDTMVSTGHLPKFADEALPHGA